jgi:hypothetical protein
MQVTMADPFDYIIPRQPAKALFTPEIVWENNRLNRYLKFLDVYSDNKEIEL